MTKKTFLHLLAIFLIWRASLFGIGLMSDRFLLYAPTFPYFEHLLPSYHLPRWIYSWANFDGVHYLTIADHGYIGTGLIQAFFPLFPYVFLRVPHEIIGSSFNSMMVGLVLTNFFAFAFLIVWFLFVKERLGEKAAYFAVALYLTFPTAFFLGAFYTESLFLFLTISTFLASRRQKWWLVGILIALASATRVVGVLLVPALLLEVWQQFCEQKPKKKTPSTLAKKFSIFLQTNWQSCLWIVAGSIGLLSYMAFLTFSEFHDPLYFLHVQAAFGSGRQTGLVLYPQVVWRALKILLTSRPFDWRYFASVQEFIVGVFGFMAILLSFKTARWSEFTFCIAAFLLPTLTGTFSSISRYFLVSFSFYYFLTYFLQNKRVLMLCWLSISTVFLILNTILFIQGYWVA